MQKKIEYVKKSLMSLNEIFICPICNETMILCDNFLKCKNNHCFDISHQGCLSLLKNNGKRDEKIYNKNLFESRIKFINCLFYEKVYKAIANVINKRLNKSVIIDIGCGDGTHDKKIYDLLENKNKIYFIGIDISKIGIKYFSNYVSDKFIPVISDLHFIPLENKSVDVILNILSPSNGKEMKRILKNDGVIIKVTPQKDYLKELREAMHIKEYGNESIIDTNIRKNYNVIQKYEIAETYSINSDIVKYLVRMTPLSKNYTIKENINCITIALNIYVLVPKV